MLLLIYFLTEYPCPYQTRHALHKYWIQINTFLSPLAGIQGTSRAFGLLGALATQKPFWGRGDPIVFYYRSTFRQLGCPCNDIRCARINHPFQVPHLLLGLFSHCQYSLMDAPETVAHQLWRMHLSHNENQCVAASIPLFNPRGSTGPETAATLFSCQAILLATGGQFKKVANGQGQYHYPNEIIDARLDQSQRYTVSYIYVLKGTLPILCNMSNLNITVNDV